MAVVDESATAPAELSLAWDCQRWGTLPEAGGLLDQDYVLLGRMTAALNVYNTVSFVRSASGAEIHRLSGGQRALLKYLRDNGMMD